MADLVDLPPDGSVVTSQGYYWHFDRSQQIWEARLGINPAMNVLKRTKASSRRGGRLATQYELRGELPEVREWRLRGELQYRLEQLGHFVQVLSSEPFQPYCCTLCGCLVSTRYIETHRTRCVAPTEEP